MAIIEYMPYYRRGNMSVTVGRSTKNGGCDLLRISNELYKALPKMGHCRILYDDDAKQILLKMCRTDDAGAHGTARITKAQIVSCRGMWQQFGFEDPEPKTRWAAYYDDSRQMIVIELRKPLVPTRGGKK